MLNDECRVSSTVSPQKLFQSYLKLCLPLRDNAKSMIGYCIQDPNNVSIFLEKTSTADIDVVSLTHLHGF